MKNAVEMKYPWLRYNNGRLFCTWCMNSKAANIFATTGAAPSRPDPPIVGKVTHHSIELYWQNTDDKSSPEKGGGRLRFCLQEADKNNEWGNIHIGYSHSHTIEGLEPSTTYRYRCRVMNDYGNSEFSPSVTVSTTTPSRPDPPIVGKVTHHSIELYWQNTDDKSSPEKGGGRLRFCLQEADKNNEWGNIHIGYSHSHTIEGLEPSTTYRYRCRVMNDYGNSEFSPSVTVSTTKEPPSGEQLHRIINLTQDIDKIKKILETGHGLVDIQDKYGYSPLMVTAQKGLPEILDVLIDYGADVNEQNSSGKDALMLAAFAGHLGIVETLREKGASYENQDKGGSTALHWAVDAGHLPLVKWMIKDGASVSVVDFSSRWTPLMRCCAMSGNVEVARELFLAGAEVDRKDKDGKSALMIAALNGHRDLVQLLIEEGADPDATTEFDKTALDMARSFDRKEVVEYLSGIVDKSRKDKKHTSATQIGTT